MARTKPRNAELVVVDDPAEPRSAKVIQTTVTKREYVEQPDESDILVEDTGSDAEPSALETFLQTATQIAPFLLEIERLPKTRHGLTSPRAVAGEYLDTWDFTDESVHTYLKEIQDIYGGGEYRFTLKYPQGFRDDNNLPRGGQMARRWTAMIAAPVRRLNQEGRTIYVTGNGQPQTVSNSPVEQLREQTKLFKEVMGMMREIMPESAMAPASANPEVTAAVYETKAKVELLDKLLSHPKQDVAERLIGKMFGEEKEESSIWPEVLKLINSGLEMLPVLLARFAQAPPAGAAPQPAPTVANAADPQQPQQLPAAPVEQRSPSQVAYARTISFITQGILYDDQPFIALEAINQLLQRYEEWQAEIDAMMEAEPDMVLQKLIGPDNLTQAPEETRKHWAAWVTRLQEQYKQAPEAE